MMSGRAQDQWRTIKNKTKSFWVWFKYSESWEKTCLAKLFPFLKEKVILGRTTRTLKKTRNSNLLVVDSWRHGKYILKMKTFHTTKFEAYLYERLNTSKGVIRNIRGHNRSHQENRVSQTTKELPSESQRSNLDKRVHPNFQQTQDTQGSKNWRFSWEEETTHPNSLEVLLDVKDIATTGMTYRGLQIWMMWLKRPRSHREDCPNGSKCSRKSFCFLKML